MSHKKCMIDLYSIDMKKDNYNTPFPVVPNIGSELCIERCLTCGAKEVYLIDHDIPKAFENRKVIITKCGVLKR